MVLAAGGRLTDMLSFYTLPSTVINNPQHNRLAAAFQYYTVAAATPLAQLMGDALILAHNTCVPCSGLGYGIEGFVVVLDRLC